VPELPLQGRTIGITADRRADEQAQLLVSRGATVVHGPTIRTAPVDDDTATRAATCSLLEDPPDVVIANTAIGVRSWLSMADGWGLSEALLRVFTDARVIARGPKAAGAMHAAGVVVEWRAPSSQLAEVVDHLVARGVGGARVALQLDGGSRPCPESEALRAEGATVVEVPTYRWTLPTDRTAAGRLVDAACAGRLDAITFTASPAVDNLVAVAVERDQREALLEALRGPVVAMCVGPVCAAAASRHGIEGVEPPTARLGAMVKTLADELAARRRVLRIGAVEVDVQGAVVRGGGELVRLPVRERALFEALSRRPGAVVSRLGLLTEVWGSAEAAPHALEVTVARLRRRVKAVGLGVEAVPRRGYRLAPVTAGRS
jgi:uroporphyrinogen-III synthase